EKIISIPLEEEPHEDFQAWSAEVSGEYTVRSAYKLIQGIEDNPSAYALQADYKDFYKKLWLLNLPSKIKITVWNISWNFLSTRVNMLLRKLTNTTSPASKCRIFCCAIWAISGDSNDRVHKKWIKSGKEIGRFVNSYISELNKIDKNRPQISITVSKWGKPPDRVMKINFDAAYDGRSNKLAVGIVARDSEGTVLLSCSEIHQGVASAFAAEALACRKATQIGINVQWEKVIIE
ncbi:hypothetical protein Goklo_007176, partial [Gossypium klotzschianum]|nr:hypothetical protein [Gossypium klotzschianum]